MRAHLVRRWSCSFRWISSCVGLRPPQDGSRPGVLPARAYARELAQSSIPRSRTAEDGGVGFPARCRQFCTLCRNASWHIMPPLFRRFLRTLCSHYAEIFLKTPRVARRPLASRQHHISAPCTKKANNVYKDLVTKGWRSVLEMDLAVRNSNTLRGTEPIHLHNVLVQCS